MICLLRFFAAQDAGLNLQFGLESRSSQRGRYLAGSALFAHYSVFQLAENSHSKFEFLRRFSTFDILSGLQISWANFCRQLFHQAPPALDNDEKLPKAEAYYIAKVKSYADLKHKLSSHTRVDPK